MCVIIARPDSHKLTTSMIERCFKQNGDGWGIMYAEDGRVVTHRGMDAKGLLETYASIPNDQNLAIHFRWRTHGDTDLRNTHPYSVLSLEENGADLWCMHNGVINGLREVDKGLSDTWHWLHWKVKPILRLDKGLLRTEAFQDTLEDGISGSRILFLDGEGNWTFLNASRWKEAEGCHFSTTPPVDRSTYVSYGPYTQGAVQTPSQLRKEADYYAWGEDLDYAVPNQKPAEAPTGTAVDVKTLPAPQKPAFDVEVENFIAGRAVQSSKKSIFEEMEEDETEEEIDGETLEQALVRIDPAGQESVITYRGLSLLSEEQILELVEQYPADVAEFLCWEYGSERNR